MIKYQLLALAALVSVTLCAPSQTHAQSRTLPRRLESGELRANFRSFDAENGNNVVNRQITTRNNCPERVQIGGSTTSSNAPQPMRIENKTAVIDSKIAIFCGI